jgi:small-conductance mechanosensitive channel
MELLDIVFYGNTLSAWAVSVAITLAAFVFLRFVGLGAIRRFATMATKTRVGWDDIAAEALGSTRTLLLLILAAFAGVSTLALPGRISAIAQSVTVIAVLVQGGLWLNTGLTAWLNARAEEHEADDPAAVMTMNVIGIAIRIVLWSMVLLLALDNLGVDVTALVAGLGVGGVAVALAAQNILGDLFASLSIAFDKPFVLGDFLVIGDFMGSVEAIGLKTTRVRSLSGEQVVFSNNDLLTSRIRNYGRMFQRRVVFKLGVTYQTPRDKLRAIPEIVQEAVEAQGEEKARFDRSHMASYGDFAIVFETVYYVLSPDYNLHMDVQQDIFLRVHEAFEERGIEFAYPTQTLFLERVGGEAPSSQA